MDVYWSYRLPYARVVSSWCRGGVAGRLILNRRSSTTFLWTRIKSTWVLEMNGKVKRLSVGATPKVLSAVCFYDDLSNPSSTFNNERCSEDFNLSRSLCHQAAIGSGFFPVFHFSKVMVKTVFTLKSLTQCLCVSWFLSFRSQSEDMSRSCEYEFGFAVCFCVALW